MLFLIRFEIFNILQNFLMAAYATPNPSEEKKKMSSCSLKSINDAIRKFENVRRLLLSTNST